MKKGLTKNSTGITRKSRVTAITKNNTSGTITGAFQKGQQAHHQNSFMMQTSQSSASLATHATRMNGTRQGFNANQSDSRKGSLHTVGNFSSQAKIGQASPGFFKQDMRTPTGIAHRPSNLTMDRSTAMHSGMPSPSAAMFKSKQFNRGYDGTQYSKQSSTMRHTGAAAGKASTRKQQVPSKTSAYLNRYRATNKTAQFWGELTKMAEKAGKIESIDNRLNPCEPTGPATGLNTRPRAQRPTSTHVRGSGGIHKEMNGVNKREVRGSDTHEHVMEGRSVAAILQPDAAPQRRCVTPKANQFMRSSLAIGSTAQMYGQKEKPQDPAELLKPQASFRKASEASMGNRLWTNENEFGMYEEKQLTKHEVCKSRSRERYFQSSITTLPGPSRGLNCVKTRQDVDRDASENSHIQRKKGHTFNEAFSSHITTLPGTHTSTKNTMVEQEARENERQQKKYNDQSFKLKNEAFYGSYMMNAEKGRNMDVPREFGSYRKDVNENKWSRAPSNVSTEARNRLIYQSNFKLE